MQSKAWQSKSIAITDQVDGSQQPCLMGQVPAAPLHRSTSAAGALTQMGEVLGQVQPFCQLVQPFSAPSPRQTTLQDSIRAAPVKTVARQNYAVTAAVTAVTAAV